MKVPGRLLMLALLVVLAAAPVHAQDTEKCPNPEGWRLLPGELRAKLEAHEQWLKNKGWEDPTVPGRADLCNAVLRGANLQGAFLRSANLQGATLSGAQLQNANLGFAQLRGAYLGGAQLQGASLSGAQLQNANLSRAQLRGASLSGAQLQDADLHVAQLRGAYLFEAQLRAANLSYAQLQGAYLSRAQLQDADLQSAALESANLQGAALGGADLQSAKLQDANLSYAHLQGADLSRAHLQGADLSEADLSRANLIGANLHVARLLGTNLDGARLTDASLFRAQYEPATAPAAGYLTGLKGLTTLDFGPGQGSGLVLLRARLAEAGLRDLEREATYALERQTTRHKLQAWREQPASSLGGGLEGAFRWLAFELPVAYGLHPGRALWLLLGFTGSFALIYLIPLTSGGTGAIHRVWPEGRLEAQSSTAKLVGQPKVERLRPRGWWGLKRLLHALQFSLLSAFHLGFREINVGSWIARVQAHEYTLRATGWVRVVAGLQSLLSVYLLALWALTYFGRPFG